MDGYSFEPKISEKRWKVDFEKEMIEKWKKEDWWKFRPKEGQKIFVIDTPPPYPAPQWHLGAALGYTYQDMIARALRMMGHAVLYPIGMDGNGLPIEFYMEKYLGVKMFEYDREDFIRLCREELARWKENMKKIMQRYELSGDYEEYYYETDSEEYRAFTQYTFRLLWERGLIYEDERPNNWCPHCKTTIADAEVEYKEEEGLLYYVRYRVKETGEELVVATTRPELLAGCRAIIVHPEDERYKHLHGKKAVVPLYGHEVPIIPHPAAKPDFGTGAMHICSFGDFEDVRLFRELGLEPVKLIDVDGRMTEAAGPLKGLTVKEARERIGELLEREGLLVKKEKIVHRVPVHERCNTPIEIIPMKEFYLKQVEFKEEMERIAEEIAFIPERYRQNLLDWIRSVNIDWPISRRRYYGTEVPVWTCRKCGYKLVKGGEKYWRPWKEAPEEACPVCGARDWEGDGRVLDTWMDSSVTILYITRKPENLFERSIRIRPQGYDIIRTWLYYTLLRVYQLKGEKAFHYVFINGMGLDKHGRKMSKRLGNLIDPWEIVERQGADALRLWLAMEAAVGENYRINEEKIAGVKKFLTKLWNIARYVSMYSYPERPDLLPLDHWILSELNGLIEEVRAAYEAFDVQKAARAIYTFTRNIFADHYIELTKRRARMDEWEEEEAKAAWWTLHTVLKSVLLLLAPITPAITDKLWRELYGDRSIHYERFPEPVEEIEDLREYTKDILAFDSAVWKAKKERGIKFTEPIEMEVPEKLAPFREELAKAHRLI